jgi:flavin reductase (DIM6/NTAB) family NADH-FMN oxidoreductase RutF
VESAARRTEPVFGPAGSQAPLPVEAGEVGQRRFRDALGLFPTGVTLLTTRAPDGADHGMTANSVTSVSLDPMLLLVCVEHASRLHAALLASGLWGISVLPADAESLSRRLARRGHSTAEALAKVPHHRGPLTGALLLDGALSTVECRTWATHPGGDHTVVIGEVLSVATPRPDLSPLTWHRGRYTSLDPTPRADLG